MAASEDSKFLNDSIDKNSIIVKYKTLMGKYKFGFVLVLSVILFQFIFIGVQCQQNSFYRQSAKMNYLSIYQMEQKMVEADRKKDCLKMIVKVALSYQPDLNERMIAEIADTIYEKGEKLYGIKTEEWILLFSHEGRWKRTATSGMGARGPGQLMPLIGKLMYKELELNWDGPESLYNYKNNVLASMRWYFYLKNQYEKPEYYISAYNWGEQQMGKFAINNKPISGKHRKYFYKEYLRTKRHVEKVLDKQIIIDGLQ